MQGVTSTELVYEDDNTANFTRTLAEALVGQVETVRSMRKEADATVFIQTNSARQPTLRVPISLVVLAYYQAVDAGSSNSYIDHLGDTRSPDQAYTAGSWGRFRQAGRERNPDHTTALPLVN